MKKMLAILIRGISLFAICFVVGTLIAQTLIFAYVWSSWGLNGEKATQMLAIARGKEMVAVSRDELRRQKEVPPEQPSFAEIIESRAVKNRNLELREQALVQGMGQLRFEQTRQTDELAQFKQTRDGFEKKLGEIKEFQQSNGLQENIVMLQNMKPMQAKEQLVRIYESGQVDQVVMLVSGMAPTKRKKISAEFKTPDNEKILADILRRIRLGSPVALLAEQTLAELEPAKDTQN